MEKSNKLNYMVSLKSKNTCDQKEIYIEVENTSEKNYQFFKNVIREELITFPEDTEIRIFVCAGTRLDILDNQKSGYTIRGDNYFFTKNNIFKSKMLRWQFVMAAHKKEAQIFRESLSLRIKEFIKNKKHM